MHLEEYITATNEFTIEVHLWDGGPVWVVFYSCIKKNKGVKCFPSPSKYNGILNGIQLLQADRTINIFISSPLWQ